jgi:DNA-binding CsgD family transcriptional regulator
MATIRRRSGKPAKARREVARTGNEPAGSHLNGKSPYPEPVYTLWDELADFPAGATDQALDHLMKSLAGLLKADNVVWVGAIRMAHGQAAARDPLHGWRVRVSRRFVSNPEIEMIVRRTINTQETTADMAACAIAAGTGVFRTYRLRDGFVDMDAFRRTPQYRYYYEGMSITDRMWVASPVSADAESYFLFDRHRTRRRFSPENVALASAVLRGLKGFQRNLMLSHGLLQAKSPLSPTQRKVLALLLTEKSEKEIAHILSLSNGTTHQYVVELFRIFGVKSRAGLMSLWIAAAPRPTDS